MVITNVIAFDRIIVILMTVTGFVIVKSCNQTSSHCLHQVYNVTKIHVIIHVLSREHYRESMVKITTPLGNDSTASQLF